MADTWVWVPSFQVTVNGQDLDQKDEAKPIEVVFNDNVDVADFFSVRLGLVDNAIGKPDWIDDPLYKEGGKVRIKMGHEHRALKTMIDGEIIGAEVLCSSRGPETLILQGYDRHHRLRRGRKSRTFQKMTDWDIAQKIVGEHGLSLRGDPTSGRYEHIYQNNLSDFDFLMQRAARLGYEVEIENTNLYFRKSQEGRSKITTLKWGDPDDDELISFSLRLSTVNQVNEVTVRGWNPKEKKEIVGRAGVGDETTRMGGTTSGGQSATSAFGAVKAVVVDHPIFDQREADALAKARFNDLSLSYITGDGICIGNPDIRAGQVIEIKGFGRRFSGLYYVVSSNHVCGRGAGGYRTEFSVRRSAAGGEERAAAAAASVALAPPAAAPAKKETAATATATPAETTSPTASGAETPAALLPKDAAGAKPTPVGPLITLAAKVVAVKKAGGTPTRKAVTLKTDSPFDGKGTFQTSGKAIRFFTASSAGKEITFNGTDNVFTGAQLTAGIDVYAEAASGSAKMDDVGLTLQLTPGSKPVKPPAKATMTSVEVTLDICKSRTSPGTEPQALSQADKINVGRFVPLQDAEKARHRAKLIVRAVKPSDFKGTLTLVPIATATSGTLTLFDNETPAPAQVAKGNPHEFPAAKTDTAFFVEGTARPSGAQRDTGYKLGIKDLGETDADHVAATVIQVEKLQASLESTKNAASGARPAAATFDTNKADLAFAAAAADLMVVVRDAGQITVAAQNVKPAAEANNLRWQIDRDPADTVAADLPALDKQTGTQVKITPSTPGTFRLICYRDANDNNTHGAGEELRVLRMAIVRITPQAGATFTGSNAFTPQVNGVSTTSAMKLQADFLLEGGGANRQTGLDQVILANVGNCWNDTFVVNYPGRPAPSDTRAGTESEDPDFQTNPAAGFATPMVDTVNVAQGNEPTGGDSPKRGNSVQTILGNGPGGKGQLRRIKSLDSPAFGWDGNHPTTGNPWATTQGANFFREWILAHTTKFPRNYMALGRGDWTATITGTRGAGGVWTDNHSTVVPTAWTVINPPTTADAAGAQVLGRSFVREFGMIVRP